MNQIDFSQFKVPDAVNKKKPGGLPSKVQEFDDLKYRKAQMKKEGVVAKFYVSTSRFAGLNLKENELLATIHPTSKQVLLGVVGEGKGNLLKKREGKEKGTAFKSDIVEAALLASGVIADLPVGTNQFIKLTQVGTNVTLEGELCSIVFLLEKGTRKAQEAAAKVDANLADKAETPKVVETPKAAEAAKAEPAPTASAAVDEEWN